MGIVGTHNDGRKRVIVGLSSLAFLDECSKHIGSWFDALNGVGSDF